MFFRLKKGLTVQQSTYFHKDTNKNEIRRADRWKKEKKL